MYEQPMLLGVDDSKFKPAPPRQGRKAPPARGWGQTRSRAGHPAVMRDVLVELEYGLYGVFDDTDKIVIFEEDERVRRALDDDAIWHLIRQGYVERKPDRDRTPCDHEGVVKHVQPLRLTTRGQSLLKRWVALRLGGERS